MYSVGCDPCTCVALVLHLYTMCVCSGACVQKSLVRPWVVASYHEFIDLEGGRGGEGREMLPLSTPFTQSNEKVVDAIMFTSSLGSILSHLCVPTTHFNFAATFALYLIFHSPS